MNILSLNGAWKMRQYGTDTWHDAIVPGSVYADLMRDGTLPDPFWRENEHIFFELMRNDFEYERTFDVPADLLAMNRVVLRCFGLDTLCHICINGQKVADTDNMHITWGFDVKELLRAGENTIGIRFDSPIEYCLDLDGKSPMWGSTDAIPGFGYLRKAHMMFGWDWGPRLPDAGIWRDIRLEGIDAARIDGIRVEQIHEDGKVTLKLHPDIDGDAAACTLSAELICPDGKVLPFGDGTTCVVEDPQLWWPHGYGDQPLYTVKAVLTADGREQDTWSGRIGLRTLTVSREENEGGEEFCHVVNGVKVFAMGGDYIPEDNIYQRITPERTRRLLEDAALANFNAIRVWGGGYYPDDFFFDICDELGLMVWQDLMFACSFYVLTPEFDKSIRMEAKQNIRRMRNHPSLALICGNNEMEQFMGLANHLLEIDFQGMPALSRYNKNNTGRAHVADYTKMFSYILPEIAREEAPQTFWWPSSPSSGGDFDKPQDPTRGDVHYWDVWHGEKPFTDYRNYKFSYVSEFGFQSFPMLPTVESFTEPGDRNIFSRIMERHQRNKSANGKILNYLSQTFRYPNSFDNLLYASQLLQAEAIRYGVEHWRRNRGRCMGAIIWQLNDCWPVASWASIDSLGRWKALHYAAKRFFAPVMISVEEQGELSENPHINEFHPEPIERSARVSVANESREAFSGTVRWQLRTPDGAVVREGCETVTVPALTSVWLDKLTFDDASLTGHYFTCTLEKDGTEISRSSALFCAPKHFEFADPGLTVEADDKNVTVTAKGFGHSVYIESDDPDLLLSDNFFDLSCESVTVQVLRGSTKGIRVRSVYDMAR
ncbi:MAG: glycoside hydrolase family 2 protein [Clostridia bacterium]|nr:glycoside hydrolase family 2 protein [Clostridia bacterium]